MSTLGRVRWSRGSVDRQTSHAQPIIGTPALVPVPRKSSSSDIAGMIALAQIPSPRRGEGLGDGRGDPWLAWDVSPSCRADAPPSGWPGATDSAGRVLAAGVVCV